MNTNLLAIMAYDLHKNAERLIVNYGSIYCFDMHRFCDFLDSISESDNLTSRQMFELSQSASYLYEQLEILVSNKGFVMSTWIVKNKVKPADLCVLLKLCIETKNKEL